MLNPGYRYRALGELTADELVAMLGDDETLFVEHKSGTAEGSGYQVAKAASSFANTLGGWILVGVRDGRPTNTESDGWQPPTEEPFVDHIRVRLANHVDPLPQFAARVREIETGEYAGRKIGVVRVYESSDTPHIMREGGTIFVRETAGDRRYKPERIRSHAELVALAERGERSRRAAEGRFAEGKLPLVDQALKIEWTDTITESRAPFRMMYARNPAILLRLTPLNLTPRFAEWATSQNAVGFAEALATALTTTPRGIDPPIPHASGFAMVAREEGHRRFSSSGGSFSRHITVVVDAGGAVGVRVQIHAHPAFTDDFYELTGAESARPDFIDPLLVATTQALEQSEWIGRFHARCDFLGMGAVLGAYATGGERHPDAWLPLGGDLTVPALVDGDLGPEAESLARRWSYEVARASGLAVFS